MVLAWSLGCLQSSDTAVPVTREAFAGTLCTSDNCDVAL